jgi:D-glycero-alpha-D-manno-heptose 1-phosphate guanylyltransferase
MADGLQAVVLAGGLGTRLRSVVSDVPKPLAPVAGRPFLHWLLDALDRQGVRQIVLAVGFMAEQVRAAVGERHGRIAVSYSVETEPLGTGGALREALRLLDGEALVLNGDTYVQVDFARLMAAHRRANALVTVATVDVDDASRYGTVQVVDGRIAGFVAAGRSGPGTINAGVYALSATALHATPAGPFSFERDLLQARLAELAPLAFAAGPAFIDIGTPADYRRAQKFFVG